MPIVAFGTSRIMKWVVVITSGVGICDGVVPFFEVTWDAIASKVIIAFRRVVDNGLPIVSPAILIDINGQIYPEICLELFQALNEPVLFLTLIRITVMTVAECNDRVLTFRIVLSIKEIMIDDQVLPPAQNATSTTTLSSHQVPPKRPRY